MTEKNGEVVIDMVDAVAFGRDGTSFPVGRTLYKTTPDSMGVMCSDISLYEDGTFHMWFGSLSSYTAAGPYSLEKGQLVLNTSDGEYTYRFDVVGDKLVYRAKGSSTMDWYANLFDTNKKKRSGG